MRFLNFLLLIVALAACTKPSTNTLVIGSIAGPETELLTVAQKEAEKRYGLTVRLVTFNDYHLPNEALQDGSLDANVYQHLPYLQATMKAHGYSLMPIGKTFVYPMGIYSQKIKSLDALAKGAVVALPNDPSNELRALLLLEKAQLISLKKNTQGSLQDIQDNPHHLQFKELDAAQLPRVLADVDIALINTTFALPAGLSPSKDALFVEDKTSPYANLIVIRKETKKKAALLLFVKAFQSDAVKNKAKALFGDAAIPAW